MKILIFSVAPWLKTGYGKTCRHLLSGLKKRGHSVDVACYFGLSGATLTLGDTKVIPTYGYLDGHCADSLAEIANSGYDVVIQHFDVWTLPKEWIKKIKPPVITFSPIDCNPIPKKTVDASIGAAAIVAMSPWAQYKYSEAGIKSIYMPHFYDDTVYKPLPKDECRKSLAIECKGTLFGIVGTNRSIRKNIPGMLLAFAEHIKTYPDDKLYMHTYIRRDEHNPEGISLNTIIDFLHLTDNVLVTDQEKYITGIDESLMPIIYNSIDYLLECSCGEGFAIPIIEAQACGVPAIVHDFSALKYTGGEGALYVPEGAPVYMELSQAFMAIPNTNDIVKALNKANLTNYTELSNAAIQNAADYKMEDILNLWDKLVRSL